jgi:hypothetical protein
MSIAAVPAIDLLVFGIGRFEFSPLLTTRDKNK